MSRALVVSVVQLIQVLGRHSMNVKQLKRFVGMMKSKLTLSMAASERSLSRPPWYSSAALRQMERSRLGSRAKRGPASHNSPKERKRERKKSPSLIHRQHTATTSRITRSLARRGGPGGGPPGPVLEQSSKNQGQRGRNTSSSCQVCETRNVVSFDVFRLSYGLVFFLLGLFVCIFYSPNSFWEVFG